jgi:hypothetical protein
MHLQVFSFNPPMRSAETCVSPPVFDLQISDSPIAGVKEVRPAA